LFLHVSGVEIVRADSALPSIANALSFTGQIVRLSDGTTLQQTCEPRIKGVPYEMLLTCWSG
jgi:hypothetical protein